jgi:hypothetical protein
MLTFTKHERVFRPTLRPLAVSATERTALSQTKVSNDLLHLSRRKTIHY